MQIYTDYRNLKLKNTAVTLGKFDGIHRGHQKLIQRLLQEKEQRGLRSVLFSFDITTMNHQQVLTTKEERKNLCEQLGIEDVVFYPVTQNTMAMTPQQFIEDVLVQQLDAKVIVTGKDFRFGKNRMGDVNMLREYSKIYGYSLFVEDSVNYQEAKISSSNIKECILAGNLTDANEMLGYPYFVMGEIVKGKQVGRTIGTRTINIHTDSNKIVPPRGVYKTMAELNHTKYKGLTNVGLCPTVSSNNELTIETHLLDFNQNVYGQIAKIEFYQFIRPEKKFGNLDELKKQILLDISEANL